jgi:hypothetical protein
MTVLGLLLVAAGALLVLADADGISRRLPTQVPPRSFARYPIAVGVALIVLGAIGLALG